MQEAIVSLFLLFSLGLQLQAQHHHDHDHSHVESSSGPVLTCPDVTFGEALTAYWTPDTALVFSCGIWTLVIVNDSTVLSPGAEIKILAPRGWVRLQKSSPGVQGYVSATSTNPASNVVVSKIRAGNKDDFPLWSPDKDADHVTVQVQGTPFPVGDSIFVQFGSPGPGQACLNRAAQPVPTRIAWDAEYDGTFRELVNRPIFRINPGFGQYGFGFVHSVVDSGRNANLQVVIYDPLYNRADRHLGTWSVSSTDPIADIPSTISFSPSDSGRLEVGVRFNTPGTHYLFFDPVSVDDPVESFRSNPVRVRTRPDGGIYWGEFHYHSSFSRDAIGTPGYNKGRNVACLDFFAPTDHSHTSGANSGLDCVEWEAYQMAAIANYEPGRFVPFLGYETSYHSSQGGHHNHVFHFNNSNVQEVPVFWDAPDVPAIWDEADVTLVPGVRMLSIPHHTGKWFDSRDSGRLTGVPFGPGNENRTYRRLIEIMSTHGTSELYDPSDILAYEFQSESTWSASIDGLHYAQDAWALGERLGVIASSDDHSSRGGTPQKPILATWAPKLDRGAIFDGLHSRNTYGTTGDRMLLDFRGNGFLMGSEVSIPTGEVPELSFDVWGTDTLLSVIILKWDLGNGVWVGGHPKYDTLFAGSYNDMSATGVLTDPAFADSALYYVKAMQYSEHSSTGFGFAWSSPIWFKRSDCAAPQNPRTLVLGGGKVRLSWDPVPGASSYQVCGKPMGVEDFRCEVTFGTQKVFPALDTTLSWMWRVRAECATGVPSPYTAIMPFAFTNIGYAREGAFQPLYPNPSSGQIVLDAGKDPSEILILDAMGRLVATEQNRTGQIQLDLGHLPDGWYLVRIQSGDRTRSERFLLTR